MKIACIGSGDFGIAMAFLLSKVESNQVIIWSHDKNWVSKCHKKKQLLGSKLSSIQIPSNVSLTSDYNEAIDGSDVLFLLTSSKYFLDVINELKYHSLKKKHIFIGTKGMLSFKPYFLSIYAKKALKTSKIAYFAGPNYANDLLDGNPSLMTVATKKKKNYSFFQKLLPGVRTEYTSYYDMVELSSVLKNIYAVGAGIIYNKYSSSSSLVSYASMAYQEMCHLLIQATNHYDVYSYKGILGDFFLTNMNLESRNFSFGIARSQSSNHASNYLKKYTVEGYDNLENIVNYLGHSLRYYPILFTIYDIIYKNKNTDTLLNICFKRD